MYRNHFYIFLVMFCIYFLGLERKGRLCEANLDRTLLDIPIPHMFDTYHYPLIKKTHVFSVGLCVFCYCLIHFTYSCVMLFCHAFCHALNHFIYYQAITHLSVQPISIHIFPATIHPSIPALPYRPYFLSCQQHYTIGPTKH